MSQKLEHLIQIETPRLIIRPIKLGDEVELNKAVNNSLSSLQKWMPWAKDTRLEVTQIFVKQAVLYQKSEFIIYFPMVVIHKEKKAIIGCSGYNNIKKGIYEIGFWCDIDYQGKGYVTEWTNALVRYALKELKAKKVVMKIAIDNLKSIAVAKRLKFHKTNTESKNHYFTSEDITALPPLDINWKYKN